MSDRNNQRNTAVPDFTSEKAWSVLKVALIIGVAVVVAYFLWFNVGKGYSLGEPDAWGQFGDYVGGLLNPIFSFLALLVLVLSLVATSHALKQNKEILEVTKDELRLTRKQIVDTEKALKEQSKTVHSNAYAERLFSMAEKIHAEILNYHEDRPENEMDLILFKERQGWVPISLAKAFDVRQFDQAVIRRADQWEYRDWLDQSNERNGYRYVRCFWELSKIVRKSRDATGTSELRDYYTNRLWFWAVGLNELGYLSGEKIACLVPDSYKPEVFKVDLSGAISE